jgi:CPA1 family monovalent cation:H+ antiporter
MRTFRVPYPVVLVLVGLAVGYFPKPYVVLTPQLVLFVFLPPLLFAGAWGLPIDHLRRNWVPIAVLATAGVAVGIAASFAVVHFGGGLDARVALLFGAIVAATDPVAVLALFRSMQVDKDLSTVVEGESLFNDGTGVVAFRSLLAGVITGGVIEPSAVAISFALLTIGGAALGLAGGFALRPVLRLAKLHPYLYLGASVAIAYGIYDLAETLRVSGIIAVLCCGLVLAHYARSLPDKERISALSDRFWEGLAVAANVALFVMLGRSVNLAALLAAWPATGWAILAVVLGRAATVYGLAPACTALGSPLPARWQHVIAIGGMRGALSTALALGLPIDTPQRELLTTMVFCVVIFTLVVQGICVQWVLPRPVEGARSPARLM